MHFSGVAVSPVERLVTVVVAFAFALLATRVVLEAALRFNLLDRPSSRSSHSAPTPRGGGLAIVLAFMLALLALYLTGDLGGRLAAALAFGGLAIAGVGFIDDRWSLPASVRFLVHLGAAAFAVTLIGVPSGIFGGLLGQPGWLGWAVIVIAMVWATNLFNFMDGIDGIAALEAAFFASAAAGINAYLAGDSGLTTAMLSLAAASAGFLVWNWPPARIFMGDVGSGFLGFTLAACALAMSHDRQVAVEVSLILGGVFVVDASVTLIRRIARGDRWFEAHRTHAYQHLAHRWGSHLPATLLVGFIDVAWLLPWAIAAAAHPSHAMLCVTSAYLPLVILAVAVGAGVPRPEPGAKGIDH